VQHPRTTAPRGRRGRRVEVRDRVELDLERSDDAEVATAAAQRPEQVGVVVGVDAAKRPSAVTSSIAAMLFVERPSLRAYQPTPPPSE
jgi:hypothetical protein